MGHKKFGGKDFVQEALDLFEESIFEDTTEEEVQVVAKSEGSG